jgi:hypothetical protein
MASLYSSSKNYVDNFVKTHIVNIKDIIHKDRDLIDWCIDNINDIINVKFPELKAYVDDEIGKIKSYVDDTILALQAWVTEQINALQESVTTKLNNAITDMQNLVNGYINKPFAYTGINHNVSFGNVESTGTITCKGDIWAFYSDERLKNIIGVVEDATKKLNTLQCIYWQNNETANELLKNQDNSVKLGLIAQEVQKIAPEVVGPSPLDSRYLTIQYDKLITLLIKALQEQDRRIEQLENCIFDDGK